ncbi:hypothetical protein B6U84_00080 [Candidatus Bathyarchaeota archaeon ex4484_40]|nr:MAG: hypothetical protein B6U84_00080 [Candidatus Bathyarchaeota archaeon ex4484_40]
MSFEDISQALNRLLKTVTEVYRGYYQYTMAETIFCGLLTGSPVLLIGSHGTMKTSMASFIGKLFDKPVVMVEESVKSRSSLERFFEGLAGKLKVDPECLMRNLVDGVNVEYEQTGKTLNVKAEINVVKHPQARKLSEGVRKPIEVFSMQVNDQMDPEDILGYGIDHPALLGMKPPHALKRGKLAGADYVCLDEIFGAPRLLAKLHHALNEKVVDTTVGPVEAKPVAWVLCSNPFNSFYQTNIKIVNVATLDRYAFSARSLPPSAQEVLLMARRWRKLRLKKYAPIELIYEARNLMETVEIPEEYMVFCLGLVSHLSRCYFSTSRGKRAEESKDPFEAERDCSLCIYKDLPCGIANVGKVRTIIRMEQAMKAHALLNMRETANEDDLSFALMAVLPHRLSWNNEEFLTRHGSIFTAAKALVEKYAELFSSQYVHVKEVESLIKKPDPKMAVHLKEKYRDAPIVRSLLDEIIDMMKESAKKRCSRETLEALEPRLKIGEAVKAVKGAG